MEITGYPARWRGSGDALYPLLRTLPLKRRGVSGWSGLQRERGPGVDTEVGAEERRSESEGVSHVRLLGPHGL